MVHLLQSSPKLFGQNPKIPKQTQSFQRYDIYRSYAPKKFFLVGLSKTFIWKVLQLDVGQLRIKDRSVAGGGDRTHKCEILI